MAHVFRAIWIDNSLNLSSVVPEEFSSWLRSRGTPLPVVEGQVSGTRDRNVTFVKSKIGSSRVVQLSLRELIENGSGSWMTTVTGMTLSEHNVLWVDMHADIPGVWNRSISAPRIVRSLLLAGGHPVLGIDEIEPRPKEINDVESVQSLVEKMRSEYRWIPHLVCVGGRDSQRSLAIQRATRAAEVLSGVANVYVVHSDMLDCVNELLDGEVVLQQLDSLMVLPGWGLDVESPHQMMYIDGDELGDDTRTLGLLSARRLGTLSRWVVPEEEWSSVKRAVDALRRGVQQEATSTLFVEPSSPIRGPLDTLEDSASVQNQLLDALIAEIGRAHV